MAKFRVPVSSIVTMAMLVAYIVLSIIQIILLILYVSLHWHAIISVAGVIVLGSGFFIYRMFRGQRTDIIKYVHMVVMLIASILIATGIVLAFFDMGMNKTPMPPIRPRDGAKGGGDKSARLIDKFLERSAREAETGTTMSPGTNVTRHLHVYPSFVMGGSIFFQLLFAMLFFVCWYDRPRIRYFVAPLHDIVGIWIYVMLVGCSMSGIQSGDDFLHMNALVGFFAIASIANVAVVLIVVLSPFFEWEIVR